MLASVCWLADILLYKTHVLHRLKELMRLSDMNINQVAVLNPSPVMTLLHNRYKPLVSVAYIALSELLQYEI